MDLSGIDMNDSINLSYYSQLLVFQGDSSKQDITFSDPDRSQQKVLHSLAHEFGFVYEYSRVIKCVTISRFQIQDASGTPDVQTDILGIGSTTSSTINDNESEGEETIRPSGVSSLSHPSVPTQQPNVQQDFYLENDLDFPQLPWMEGDFGFNTFQDEWQGLAELPRDPYMAPAGENSDLEPNKLETLGDYFFSTVTVTQRTPPDDMPLPRISNPVQLNEYLDHDDAELQNSHPLDQVQVDLQPLPSPPLAVPVTQPDHRASFMFSGSQDIARDASDKPLATNSEEGEKLVNFYGSRTWRQAKTLSTRSVSTASNSVASSGPCRSGALHSLVATAQKTVKAVGACWRCKILRKSCNPETPCIMCPKGETGSSWRSIGCKRGTLKSELPSANLCPISHPLEGGVRPLPLAFAINSAQDVANGLLKQHVKKRETQIQAATLDTHQHLNTEGFIDYLQKRYPILQGIRDPDASSQTSSSAILSAQDDCIMTIEWELLEWPASRTILGNATTTREIIFFLHSAALYHSDVQSRSNSELGTDQLIPQSLICLRTCLEAIRVNRSLGPSLINIMHQLCTRSLCEIEPISNINTHLDRFIIELSRVLFRKENMYHKSWWLSVFYSLCIQSYVRRILIDLAKGQKDMSEAFYNGFRQYLHLAVRLFIAASGSHDPLTPDCSISTEPSVETKPGLPAAYEVAQRAVQQSNWEAQHIFSSADYLKHVFEDSGGSLDGPVTRQAAELIRFPQFGCFQCLVPGCNAAPFQTQYLLNSHTIVHSSNRPHFCSVHGCPRSQGGRGFKRKSELVRHHRVHDGEEKYLMPDNLQRHVRVRHLDKSQDDPELLKVLAHTLEEPSKGRKRRRDNDASSL